MRKISISSAKTMKTFLCIAPLLLVLAAVAALRGQTPPHGIVTPLASAKLVFDGEPECLKVARENGDPDKGPSTFLLEAPSGAWFPRTITPRKSN